MEICLDPNNNIIKRLWCICYDLAGMAWYVVWPGGNNMVYSMAWLAWYMVWPDGHGKIGMVYFMALRAWHGADMVNCIAW